MTANIPILIVAWRLITSGEKALSFATSCAWQSSRQHDSDMPRQHNTTVVLHVTMALSWTVTVTLSDDSDNGTQYDSDSDTQ